MEWTKITLENVEEIYNIPPRRLVVARIYDGEMICDLATKAPGTIKTMAELGYYYYIELPELEGI